MSDFEQKVLAEFASIRAAMVTKDDLSGIQGEIRGIKDDLSGVQGEIRGIKDDLSGFATKDDLQAFATKEDLKGLATKEDLKAFATKEDLELSRLELLQFMQESLVTKADATATESRLMTHMDGIVSKHVAFDQELLMMRNRQDRVEERVTVLENA